ncbi:hypothetical protein CH376_22625 [Leptospira adleri]|uniref:Uncharacterized protein n=1 Tax=Leptospira adleri TaxID=2023186 RepID=A0ABX4NSM7_9LEPT|nr:hypothetical protein CH376_22625 [Leptospira adleri]
MQEKKFYWGIFFFLLSIRISAPAILSEEEKEEWNSESLLFQIVPPVQTAQIGNKTDRAHR